MNNIGIVGSHILSDAAKQLKSFMGDVGCEVIDTSLFSMSYNYVSSEIKHFLIDNSDNEKMTTQIMREFGEFNCDRDSSLYFDIIDMRLPIVEYKLNNGWTFRITDTNSGKTLMSYIEQHIIRDYEYSKNSIYPLKYGMEKAGGDSCLLSYVYHIIM